MPVRPKQSSANMFDALKTLLLAETVSTQDEIRLALEALGYDANQSKISRLLRKLGAVKITNERKQIIYSLPHEPPPPASKSILSQLIISIRHNEIMIVIDTNPGSASLIGRLLDHHREELHVLGTVAGDDTVFIAPTSVKLITKTLKSIRTFLAEMQ
jgi:transcriptional regulator of arginine metabolism